MIIQRKTPVPVLLTRDVRLEGMIFHRPYVYVVFSGMYPYFFIAHYGRTPCPDAILQTQTHATV